MWLKTSCLSHNKWSVHWLWLCIRKYLPVSSRCCLRMVCQHHQPFCRKGNPTWCPLLCLFKMSGSKGKFLERAESQWSSLERYIDQLCTFKMSIRVTNQTASLIVIPALLTWTQTEGYLPTFFRGCSSTTPVPYVAFAFLCLFITETSEKRKTKNYEVWHYNLIRAWVI